MDCLSPKLLAKSCTPDAPRMCAGTYCKAGSCLLIAWDLTKHIPHRPGGSRGPPSSQLLTHEQGTCPGPLGPQEELGPEPGLLVLRLPHPTLWQRARGSHFPTPQRPPAPAVQSEPPVCSPSGLSPHLPHPAPLVSTSDRTVGRRRWATDPQEKGAMPSPIHTFVVGHQGRCLLRGFGRHQGRRLLVS